MAARSAAAQPAAMSRSFYVDSLIIKDSSRPLPALPEHHHHHGQDFFIPLGVPSPLVMSVAGPGCPSRKSGAFCVCPLCVTSHLHSSRGGGGGGGGGGSGRNGAGGGHQLAAAVPGARRGLPRGLRAAAPLQVPPERRLPQPAGQVRAGTCGGSEGVQGPEQMGRGEPLLGPRPCASCALLLRSFRFRVGRVLSKLGSFPFKAER